MELIKGEKTIRLRLRKIGKKSEESITFFQTTRKDRELIRLLQRIVKHRNLAVRNNPIMET